MRDQLEKGEQLILQGRTGQARAVFREILRQDPTCGEAMNNLGVIHMHQGDVAAAETYFVQASEVRPDCKSVWLNLAALHRQQQRWEQVAEDLDAYIRLDDANAVAWNQMGLVRLRLGDVPAARRALRRSLEINGDQHVIRETLEQLDREASLPGLTPSAPSEPDPPGQGLADPSPVDAPRTILLACQKAGEGERALADALERRGLGVRLAVREDSDASDARRRVAPTVLRDEKHFWDLAGQCDLVHARDAQLGALALAGETPVVLDARTAPRACPTWGDRTARALAVRGAGGRIFASRQDETQARQAFGPLGPCAVLPAGRADAPCDPTDQGGDAPATADEAIDSLLAFYREVLDAAGRGDDSGPCLRKGDDGATSTSTALDRAIDGVIGWLDRNGLEGHDAADLLGHLSRQGDRHAPAEVSELLARASSDPLAVRSELGVATHRSPEAVAMAMAGFLRLDLLAGNRGHLDRAVALGEELHALAIRDEQGRLAWALPYDRHGPVHVPAGTPCASVSVTVAEALADLHEATGDGRHRHAVEAACRFLLDRLALAPGEGQLAFARTPLGDEGETALDLYCAELLARVGSRWGDEACLAAAQRVAGRAVDEQREDGSIPSRPSQAGVPTRAETCPASEATSVAALLDLGEFLDDDAIRLCAARALARFLDTRMTCDGLPAARSTRLVDCARAAEMLARASSEHAPLLDRAEAHIRWMIDRLGRDDGHFAHRLASGRVEDGPFVTDQAAAFRAIAEVRAVRAMGQRGQQGRGLGASTVSGEPDWPVASRPQTDGTYRGRCDVSIGSAEASTSGQAGANGEA